jgi:hypothetical protein
MQAEIVEGFLKARNTLDAIARAIVSGERGLGEAEDRIADDVASLMINRLAAAQAPGHRRVAHLRWDCPERRPRIEERYGRPFLQLLIRRTDKHLDHLALLTLTDEEP